MNDEKTSRFTKPTTQLSENEAFQLIRKLGSVKGWVSFIGVMLIILGILAGIVCSVAGVALTVMGGWTGIAVIILGLAAGVIAVLLGAMLIRAGKGARLYTERGNELGALTYHEKLRSYFSFRGVLSIIGLCIVVLAVIGLVVSLFTTGLGWSF